jgi:hypothetical protein
MAYREVTMVEIKEVLRLWMGGRVLPQAAQAEVSRHQGWTEEGGIGQLIRVMRRQEPRGECF